MKPNSHFSSDELTKYLSSTEFKNLALSLLNDIKFASEISKKLSIPLEDVVEFVTTVRHYRDSVPEGDNDVILEEYPDIEVLSIKIETNQGPIDVNMKFFTDDLVTELGKLLLKYFDRIFQQSNSLDKIGMNLLFDMIVDYFNSINLSDLSRHYAIGLFQIHFSIESDKFLTEQQYNTQLKAGTLGPLSAQDYKHYLAERVRSRIKTRKKHNPNL